MNRWISVLAVLGTTLAVQAAPPPPQEDQRVSREGVVVIEGYVSEVQFNQRLLRVSGQQFSVPIDTSVRQLQGGSHSFSLLQPGQGVRIAYHHLEGAPVADEIWVLPSDQLPDQN